jgi:hypothetical protein
MNVAQNPGGAPLVSATEFRQARQDMSAMVRGPGFVPEEVQRLNNEERAQRARALRQANFERSARNMAADVLSGITQPVADATVLPDSGMFAGIGSVARNRAVEFAEGQATYATGPVAETVLPDSGMVAGIGSVARNRAVEFADGQGTYATGASLQPSAAQLNAHRDEILQLRKTCDEVYARILRSMPRGKYHERTPTMRELIKTSRVENGAIVARTASR